MAVRFVPLTCAAGLMTPHTLDHNVAQGSWGGLSLPVRQNPREALKATVPAPPRILGRRLRVPPLRSTVTCCQG